MSRRIVVGLDGSEYSDSAIRVACAAAEAFDGVLVGVAVVDQPGIEASSRGGGIGSSHYAKAVREQRLTSAEVRTDNLLDEFEATCKSANVRYELAHHHGVPFQAIVDESRYADLIVVGIRTNFHPETRDEHGDTLRRLMQSGVCPVLAVPKDAGLPKRAVIAYDGSIHSARAMREFVQLGSVRPDHGNLILLHVGESSKSEDHVQLTRAHKYIAGYDFDVELVRRDGHPDEVIEQVAEEHAPCMVVIGAYGRKGIIQNLFFGSTADRLIKNERFPLFVYH
ncbi:MAG: universal stress protein UspA [Phycisphaerae bacterium]|nr:MAG: universal stress protein UspA [Phycisphaerae bacterium]